MISFGTATPCATWIQLNLFWSWLWFTLAHTHTHKKKTHILVIQHMHVAFSNAHIDGRRIVSRRRGKALVLGSNFAKAVGTLPEQSQLVPGAALESTMVMGTLRTFRVSGPIL